MRWVALGIGIVCAVLLLFGGWNSASVVLGTTDHALFLLGVLVLAAYVPLHLWRRFTDRRSGGGRDTPRRAARGCRTGSTGMSTPIKRLARRRGDPPPASPRDVVVVLRPNAAASPELLAAARATGGTVTVVLPLKIHGYALGMPNPGLLPTARERAAADDAITATVRGLDRAGIDVDGQIVATRHAAKAIARIVRRRGATRVLHGTGQQQPTAPFRGGRPATPAVASTRAFCHRRYRGLDRGSRVGTGAATEGSSTARRVHCQ